MAANTAYGDNLEILVTDQQGKAVANAVVEIPRNPVTRAPETVAIIDQINKHFVPMVIAVQRGQRVNFPNNDNIRHHVYSFSAIKQFSTELYADIPGNPIEFDKAGVAVLGCNIHDSMVGYIYVSEWQQFAVSDDNGIARFEDIQTPDEVLVWHPWSQDPDNRRIVRTIDGVSGGRFTIQIPIAEPAQVFGFRALITE
ncbi:MAG: methylamine utilization protein [Pseudomonadales bacterium]|nr:methylamine utilization protein [Pseudomonadales bacterium]